jgi:hypothetical protein
MPGENLFYGQGGGKRHLMRAFVDEAAELDWAGLDKVRQELDVERATPVVDRLAERWDPLKHSALDNGRFAFWSDEAALVEREQTDLERGRARLGLSLAVAVKAERAAAIALPAADRTKITYAPMVEHWLIEHAHEPVWREDFRRHHQNLWRLWEWTSRPLSDAEILAHLAKAARKRGVTVATEDEARERASLVVNDPDQYHFLSNEVPYSAVVSPMERVILSRTWDTEGVTTGIPPEGTFDESP